ncbi:MAG: DNA polymerase III subunit beta [bacterium]|nr:DNA polymerase III subunit beta [bacterium]
MKIIILKENLKQALSSVEKGIIENNNLPILKNVLLKADKSFIVSATNLEIGVTYNAAAKINAPGNITVPFGPLYSIIQNSDSERINLIAEGNTLLIKTDNYEAKMQGVSAEEFPIIPTIEQKEGFISVEAGVLKDAVTQVAGAAQISELKPELSGILFDFQVSVLKLVATDSYRLAEKTLLNNSFKTTLNKGIKIIIPLKTISEVLRIFASDKAINIYIDTHQILFTNNTVSLISRLIDGQYPDYAAIIPQKIGTELVMERENLLSALKLVGGFAGKAADVKLRSKNETKVLEVYSANQYIGENNYLVPVKRTGDGFGEISFNSRYLLDGVRVMDGDSLSLGISGLNKPAILKVAGDTSFFYIVMPLEGK